MVVLLLARHRTLANQLPSLRLRLGPPRPTIPSHSAMALLGYGRASQVCDSGRGDGDNVVLVRGLYCSGGLPE